MAIDLLHRLSLFDHLEPWPAKLIDSMVPDIKVIYSDVDGTLLGPGGCLFLDADRQLTNRPAEAILKCHRRRVDIVLVSGRNRFQLHSDARLLGFTTWIAELGCQISYNMGDVLLSNIGDFPVKEASVWQEIKACGAPELLLDAHKRHLEYHLPWSENREFTHIFRGWIDVEAANGLLQENGFGHLKVIDNGRVKRRSASLNPDLPLIHAYHLLPKESSKASAVRKDRETRGIPKHLTAAIGDSLSDLELAPEVGVLFLVRNAVKESPEILEKVKEYPNVFITHEEMGLGWAEAVDFLLEKNHLQN